MASEVPVRKAGFSIDTLSLDRWAVVLSLALALLVRFGVLKSVTW